MAPNPRVKQLPDALANQIAAGEVVARPASVVKELLENAVDAGARSVTVEIDRGGTSRIRVVDDGCGIHPDDVALALTRHATSKIRTADDLTAIHSLGFRGEALPSIASVSRFSLRSRRADQTAGVELVVEGGAPGEVRPCGCAVGTSVEVADLFYNVPARRKFLRAVATESAHVTEVIRAIALAFPELNLELARDGRASARFLRRPDRSERVRDVLSDYELVEAHSERGPVSVHALLSSPDRARSGAGGLSLFVNERPVQDRALARAVASAYGEALERGRFPVGAVFIRLPHELVDVNVHPQKAEVRFAHARAVTDAVYSVIKDTIARRFEVPAALHDGAAPSSWRPAPVPAAAAGERWQFRDSGVAGAAVAAPRGAASPAAATRLAAIERSGMTLLARLRERFLLCDDGSGIAVVDGLLAQRALLERRAERELAAGRVAAQRLLFPIVRDIDAGQREVVDRSESLQVLGFDIRVTGSASVTMHAVPAYAAAAPAEWLLTRALDALLQHHDAHALLADCAAQAAPNEPLDETAIGSLLELAAERKELVLARLTYDLLEREAERR